VETIVNQKGGNQLTHLLNLLHRVVTADIPFSPWVISFGNAS